MQLDKFINVILGLIIVVGVLLIVTKFFGRNPDNIRLDLDDEEDGLFSFAALCRRFIAFCDSVERTDYESLGLSKQELEKRLKTRDEFQLHRRKCHMGDPVSRNFMLKQTSKFIAALQDFDVNNIPEIWDITNDEQSSELKFYVLSYIYNVKHKDEWMTKFIEDNELGEPKQDGESLYFDIDEDDVNKVWLANRAVIDSLEYLDKIEILAQRVYQSTQGNGCIDSLLEANIDGVSGGVSGVPSSLFQLLKFKNGVDPFGKFDINFNSVWIMFRGNQTQLRFLGFGSDNELNRICKNIYSYNSPRHLSQALGFIANTRANGSRVVVFRPSFSNWVFFVRNFGTGERADPYKLLKDKSSEKIIELSKWTLKGSQTTVYTGGQGAGKTTFIVAIIKFIYRVLPIRTLQLTSELHLNKLLPNRNIVEVFETATVLGQMALDILKKTDALVTIIGETATYVVANWFLQSCETGSEFGLTTGHMSTIPDLINYYTQAQVICAGSTEKDSRLRSARLIKFNVHLRKTLKGHRFVERVTEICSMTEDTVPTSNNVNDYIMYDIKQKYKLEPYSYYNVAELIGDEYFFTNKLSEEKVTIIREKLMDEDVPKFNEFLAKMNAEVDSGIALQRKAELSRERMSS